MPRLRDPGFASVILVALPESTPVHEAAALQEALRRASFPVHAWVVNPCLTPWTVTDPVLVARRIGEARTLREVGALCDRVVWKAYEPAVPAVDSRARGRARIPSGGTCAVDDAVRERASPAATVRN